MEGELLTKELISDPSMWRLSIEIGKDILEVMMYSLLGEQSLIYRQIALDKTKSHISALEDAIYDNSILLGNFRKIDILINTDRWMIVPEDITDFELQAEMMSVLWHDVDSITVDNVLTSSGELLLMDVDKRVLAFIQRTFPTAKIQHRLTSLIIYFYNKERLNNTPKLYLNLGDETIDIIVLDNGKIKMVNTLDTATADDVVYYVMASINICGLDVENDEIIISGDQTKRDNIASELRKYVRKVIPFVFPPSIYKAGKDALKAPLELILLPICE